MARQRIPITKGQNFSCEETTPPPHHHTNPNISRIMAQFPHQQKWQKKTATFPINKPTHKNTPSLISPSVPNSPMPGIARRPRPSPSSTWRGAITRLRLPRSRATHFFHVQNFGCKWKCLGLHRRNPSWWRKRSHTCHHSSLCFHLQ